MSKETDKELAETVVRLLSDKSFTVSYPDMSYFAGELARRLLAATERAEGLEGLVTKLSTTPPFYVVPGYEDCSGKEILEIIESRSKI